MADARTDENHPAEQMAADFVSEHPGVTTVGRAGWFAKGVVYLVAGFLAAFVALDSLGWDRDEARESGEASPTGALKEVAYHALGRPLLIALAVGLLVYAGWRIVSAAMPGPPDVLVRMTRAGYVVSAVMYTSFAFTALKLVFTDPSETDGNSTVTDLTTFVMRHTGGRIVIGVVGVVLGGVAVYRADKGRRSDVTDELDLDGVEAHRLVWIRRLGSIGEIGRGLAVALIAFFLVRAAAIYRPEDATGLDGALRRASEHLWTKIAVPIVAAGFICYGVFCLMTFRRRRFESPG